MRKIIILTILSFMCYQGLAQDEDIGDPNRAIRANGKFKVTVVENRPTNFITFWDNNTQEFTAYDGNFFDTGYISATDSSILLLCNTQSGHCISIKMSQQLQAGLSDTLFIRRQTPTTHRQIGGGAIDSIDIRRLFFNNSNPFSKTTGILFDIPTATSMNMRGRGGTVNKGNLAWDFGHSGGSGIGETVNIRAHRNTDSALAWAINGRFALFHGVELRDTGISYINGNFTKISGGSQWGTTNPSFWHPEVTTNNGASFENKFIHSRGRFVNVDRDTIASTHVLTNQQEIIYADAKSNNITITLLGLGVGGVNNIQYIIKRIDSNAANTVTILPPSSGGLQQIDRYKSLRLDTAASITVVGKSDLGLVGGIQVYSYRIINKYGRVIGVSVSGGLHLLAKNEDIIQQGEKIAGFNIWFICLPLALGIGIGIGQKINNKNATNKL